jgi:Na+-driven multidrug efflux pump
VIKIGSQFLSILPCFYVFLGLTHSFNGVLGGAGDMTFVMVSSAGMMFARFLIAKALIHALAVSYTGIFWSWPISWVLAAAACFIRYKTVFRRKRRPGPA